MRNTGVLILTGLIWLTACHSPQTSVNTYHIHSKPFTEKIYGTGTLQSVNNFTIVAPIIYSSDIKVTWLAPEGSHANAGDTVCILKAPDIQNYYDAAADDLEKSKAGLISQEADNALQTSQLESQLKVNKARMSITQLDSIQVKFAPPVKQKIMKLEMEKVWIQEQKIRKQLEAQKKINEQTLRALRSRIIQKEQIVQRFRDQLNMLYVIAPQEGMVVHATSRQVMYMNNFGVSTSGGKVEVGTTVRRHMSLIELPDLNNMQILLMVQEADFKRINKGQKVTIRSDADSHLQTSGTVSNKSLTSQPMAYKYKVKTYKVFIDIDSLDM